MISGGMKINQFAQIRLIFKAKFGDDPLAPICSQTLTVYFLQKKISN